MRSRALLRMARPSARPEMTRSGTVASRCPWALPPVLASPTTRTPARSSTRRTVGWSASTAKTLTRVTSPSLTTRMPHARTRPETPSMRVAVTATSASWISSRTAVSTRTTRTRARKAGAGPSSTSGGPHGTRMMRPSTTSAPTPLALAGTTTSSAVVVASLARLATPLTQNSRSTGSSRTCALRRPLMSRLRSTTSAGVTTARTPTVARRLIWWTTLTSAATARMPGTTCRMLRASAR
mmetsp:Transcript_7895/g.27997  ORF Transcript_7895/g.27997 Transcript_7895/m.27997 type:complete len:239 (+) Transcript_7895:1421-2137(+)